MGKQTTEQFIEKAKKIHGDKYDYSKSEYTKSSENLIIICQIHGEFLQSPSSHLKGAGCKQCGTARTAEKRKYTTEQFVELATSVHGNKYDYSKTIYTDSRTDIEIACKIHGVFKQSPTVHLKGSGCKQCLHESLKTTFEEFVNKANLVHNNKYTYSEHNFTNLNTKMEMSCPEHGAFYQAPSSHIAGQKCRKCAFENSSKIQQSNIQEFLEKAFITHGSIYDYSLVEYRGNKKKVKIVCRKHGEFNQIPNNHLNGQGCPECAKEVMKTWKLENTEIFVAKAKAVHGDKYDYSLVEYVNSQTNVKVVCPEHGEFFVKPAHHLCSKTACNLCTQGGGFKQGLAGYVYVLESADYFKVGITNKEVGIRVRKINTSAPQPFTSVYYKEMSGAVCNEVENKLLKWLRSFLRNPPTRFDGSFESFHKHIPITQVVDKLLEFEQEVLNEHNS